MATARPPGARTELSWSGWGDPALATELPDGLRALLRDGLGVQHDNPAPRSLDQLVLVPQRLGRAIAGRLTEIVGPDHAHGDAASRARHARGRSTLDLLALRSGAPLPAPDLVLTPGSHDEVLELLALAAAERVAVVPYGGGTSVVGGLVPEADGFAGVVALDLRRLNALIELDEESRLAVLEPGLRGPEAEALLHERGFTIGHFPQSFEYGTLGGFAATRSSGQASAGYGRFDDIVLGMRLATPRGTLTLGRAPRSAAGPDLRQLVLGSEGALGVITAVTVQIRPRPERRVYEGFRFPSFAEGAQVLRALVQDGPVPTVLRLSDEAETALGLARPNELGRGSSDPAPTPGALAILGWEGTAEDVERRRTGATEIVTRAGAVAVPGAGNSWADGRYRAPYLRDALLDAGALVETLETATFWSRLGALYEAVGAAIRDSLAGQGTPPAILCHISHVYPAGASLYFTIACAQLPDAMGQWRAAKAAAGDAILRTGGSITHHHGVGADHRPWYEREIGPLGTEALRAVKRALDPAGVLNPGILLAP